MSRTTLWILQINRACLLARHFYRLFGPLHFHAEYIAKMANDGIGNNTHVDLSAQESLERCHSLSMQAAGHNPIKKTEICVDIESKTVGCDPSRHVHAHGDQFVVAYPNAACARIPLRLYTKLSCDSDKNFLK